jgi:hypothetical protein
LRIWQIKEQVVEDPSTKLRLEFSSVYTDEVNAGNEPPLKDELLVIRLWTSDRTRIASFMFERNGRFVHALVEPLPAPADLPRQGVDASFTQNTDPLGPPIPPEGYAQADEVAFGKAAFSGL